MVSSEPLFSGAAPSDAEARFLMGSAEDVDKLFDTEKALLALVRKLQGNVTSLQEQLGEQEKQLFSERSAKEEALRKAGLTCPRLKESCTYSRPKQTSRNG